MQTFISMGGLYCAFIEISLHLQISLCAGDIDSTRKNLCSIQRILKHPLFFKFSRAKSSSNPNYSHQVAHSNIDW